MKLLIWLSAGIIYFLPNAVGQQTNAPIDVQHYIFSIDLNDENDSIKCVATIYFRILTNAEEIALDLISRKANGNGMKVTSITENNSPLPYKHVNDIIHISLTGVGRTHEKTIQVYYQGIPADGLIISKNKYSHRTFFADNWPNRARNWLPCVDHPSDKASVEFRVSAPDHYQVIANGIQIEQTNLNDQRKLTHYKETVPLPMKVTAIGVAEFAVQYVGGTNDISIQSWVYPEDREHGFYDYGLASEVLPFFIKCIGPYAYKKLANVQSKTTFGGLENAGTIFYSENSVTGNRSIEVLLAHEVAHQWFGNMATESQWAHLWLSEGFATYMANFYMESKYGKDTSMKMRLADRNKVIKFSKQKSAPVVNSTVTNYMELLNANSYQKGGLILHMLRKQLGDSVFWKGVRTYYAHYAGKNVLTDDFRAVLEKVSGKDLKNYFSQWLYSAGHPMLDIQWKYDQDSKNLTLFIRQQQSMLFEFPLELGIRVEHEKELTKSVYIKDKQSTLSIPLAQKPLKITIDPDVNLLYEAVLKEVHN